MDGGSALGNGRALISDVKQSMSSKMLDREKLSDPIIAAMLRYIDELRRVLDSAQEENDLAMQRRAVEEIVIACQITDRYSHKFTSNE